MTYQSPHFLVSKCSLKLLNRRPCPDLGSGVLLVKCLNTSDLGCLCAVAVMMRLHTTMLKTLIARFGMIKKIEPGVDTSEMAIRRCSRAPADEGHLARLTCRECNRRSHVGCPPGDYQARWHAVHSETGAAVLQHSIDLRTEPYGESQTGCVT